MPSSRYFFCEFCDFCSNEAAATLTPQRHLPHNELEHNLRKERPARKTSSSWTDSKPGRDFSLDFSATNVRTQILQHQATKKIAKWLDLNPILSSLAFLTTSAITSLPWLENSWAHFSSCEDFHLAFTSSITDLGTDSLPLLVLKLPILRRPPTVVRALLCHKDQILLNFCTSVSHLASVSQSMPGSSIEYLVVFSILL